MSTWNPYTTVLMRSTLKRTLTTSVFKQPSIKNVNVAPNHAIHQLIINVATAISKEMKVIITNIGGEHSKEVINSTLINLKDIPPGFYVGTVFLDQIPNYYFRFIVAH